MYQPHTAHDSGIEMSNGLWIILFYSNYLNTDGYLFTLKISIKHLWNVHSVVSKRIRKKNPVEF